MQVSTHGLTPAPNRLIVSVGFETRTEIDMHTVGAVPHVENVGALASAPNPSFMAGGDRHVQRETVKALCQSLGWFRTPGRQVRHLAAPGLRKPSTESTTMNTPDSAPAPRFLPFIIAGKAGDFPRTQPERLAMLAAAIAQQGEGRANG